MSATTVMVIYQALPGKEPAMMDKIARHAPTLRAQNLLSDRPEQLFRAGDGCYIEIIEWKSLDAARVAHENPAVLEVWGSFEGVANFLSLSELPAAVSKQRLPKFEAVNLAEAPHQGMTYSDNMISAKDLNSLAAFYEKSFGLYREVSNASFVTLRDERSHQRICLVGGDAVSRMSAGILTVDRDAALKTLENNGAKITKRWEYEKMLGANLTDPEGNEILVWQERN
jgi:predicted enzyme related to lactoylglutathione lyase